MRDTISEIIALEWDSMQNVNSGNARAACQDNYATFEQMRRSQFLAWSDPLRQSYLNDLQNARAAGRNLLTEKYARMMAQTAPQEYANIQHLLPPVSQQALVQLDMIISLHRAWQSEFAQQYPRLAARARPAEGTGAFTGDTSFTIYLRGELLTYSPETLQLYYHYVRERYSNNLNLHESIMEHTVKLAGFASLEQAERSV